MAPLVEGHVSPSPFADSIAARNTDVPFPPTSKAEKQAQIAGTSVGLGRVLIPKMPYVPPPTDPRQSAQWYERFYREHEAWRERVNQQFDSAPVVQQT